MAKKQPDINIPQHEIEALARCLLPEIQKFFESPEGQKEFEDDLILSSEISSMF